MQAILENKNIILGVSGGIAAYKSVELLRLLTKAGAKVRVIMPRNALEFVGATTFEALSGLPVSSSLFDRGEDAGTIRHIAWAEQADAVVVAPATANVIGKIAGGIADDALSTFILAVKTPVVLCPSMNTHMYENSIVQENMEKLKAHGYFLMAPGAGELACGTTGPGKLPEPPEILDRLVYCLSPKDLVGKKVLVTAGPTIEPIDPVRFISNPSSGKMGFAIAGAAEKRGARVVLVSGPTALKDPLNVEVVKVDTTKEMAEAVFANAEDADIIVKSAAVSDYRPVETAEHKIKKDKDEMMLHLEKNIDILKELGRRKSTQVLVGFAAETQELQANAQKKLAEKNLDLIVGNMVGSPSSGFGADTNIVTLFYKNGDREAFDIMEKDAVAHVLFDRVIEKCMDE